MITLTDSAQREAIQAALIVLNDARSSERAKYDALARLYSRGEAAGYAKGQEELFMGGEL